MRTLKTFTAIFSLVLLTISMAFAADYPPGLPKDFEKFPQKFCERETPTSIYLNTYANGEKNNLWVVQKYGKNKKDLIIVFLEINIVGENFGMTTVILVWHQNRWQELTDAIQTELKENPLFTEEENVFLDKCPVK